MTPKQARFVEEYLQDLNATQAAIRAGYSEKTANEQGAQLLAKPEVLAAIEAAKDERSEQAKIDALWVLKRLADEATADISDLYDDSGRLRPISDWPEIWRQGLVQGIDVEELFEGRGEDRRHVGTVRKVRLSDRVKRLELIGRHVGVKAFEDRVAVSGLEGLAERMARISRARAADKAAMAAPAAEAASAPRPAPKPEPKPEPEKRAPATDYRTDVKPGPLEKVDWTPTPKPEYEPVLPWPDRPATVAVEYDPTGGAYDFTK